jgi:beta-lactam-binding protein with PASTA domain
VEKITVPGLVGQARPDAVAQLRDLGLSPAITERDVAVQDKSQVVLEQSPTGGAELEKGDIVTLVIGHYVAPEPPPEPTPTPTPEPTPEPGPGEPTTPRQQGSGLQ